MRFLILLLSTEDGFSYLRISLNSFIFVISSLIKDLSSSVALFILGVLKYELSDIGLLVS